VTEQRKSAIRALLKGIETGDPAAVAVVNEARYIQHNPQTHEGSEGLAALFARLAKTNPRVNMVRVFSDREFVFAHMEYDFSTRRIGFEVFRFEGEQAVEHWDNIQPRLGPNLSGRSMVDGPTAPTDLNLTGENREFVGGFVEEVLIARNLELLDTLCRPDLIQHNPDMMDGVAPLRTAMKAKSGNEWELRYDRLHRVLAEGSFVLTVCEGALRGEHTAFYDLFRVEGGRIAEHWDTIEAVPPKSVWKNENGKF
jgi:predicted SnoaL-like aldol condensation-catalyzing enzyme